MFSIGKKPHDVFAKHYVNTMVAKKYKKLHKGQQQGYIDRSGI